MQQNKWSPAPVAEFKKHFAAGLSAQQTADKLTKKFGVEYNRGMVLNKGWRLGLVAPKKSRIIFGEIKNEQLVLDKIEPVVTGDAAYPLRHPWELPERGQCKYIHGDTRSNFAFICQNSAVLGQNYCEAHQKIRTNNTS